MGPYKPQLWLWVALFGLGGILPIQAQDVRFSQLFSSGAYTNPALTGVDGTLRLSLHYRHQWPSLDVEFLTGNFLMEGQLPEVNSSFGLRLLNDWSSGASYQALGIGGMYAYQLSLGEEHFFRTGVEMALETRNLDYFRFDFGDQFNEEGRQSIFTQEQFLASPLRFFNLSYGIFWQYHNFWLSASARNITRPRQTFSETSTAPDRLPIFYSWGIGARFYLSRIRDDWQLLPSFFSTRRGSQTFYQAGVQIRYKGWTGGMAFGLDTPGSSSGTLSSKWQGMTGIQQGPWKFSYSYEINLSQENFDLGNVHEFALIFYPFVSKSNRRSPSLKEHPFPYY